MTDLLSSEQKESIQARFRDIHDTFSREIQIYVLEDETLIDTDGSHNPIYNSPEDGTRTEQVLTQYTTNARIKYMDNQSSQIRNTNININVQYPEGTIRLKIDSTGYDLIKKATKLRVDDNLCELASDPSRPGPFSPDFYTIYLKRTN